MNQFKKPFEIRSTSLLSDLFWTIRDHVWTTLAVLLVITATFTVPALSITTLINAHDWLGVQSAHKQMTIFLNTDNKEEISQVQRRIEKMLTHYKSIIDQPIQVVNRDQAVEELKNHYGDKNIQDTLDLIAHNPLHDMIVLTPKIDAQLPQLLSFKELLLEDTMVYEVDVNKAWISHVNQLINIGNTIVWSVSILFLITIWISLNYAITQQLHHRKQELELKKMLGATLTQRYQPLVIWCVFLGLTGSLMAVGVSYGLVHAINAILVENQLSVQFKQLLNVYMMCISCGFGMSLVSSLSSLWLFHRSNGHLTG